MTSNDPRARLMMAATLFHARTSWQRRGKFACLIACLLACLVISVLTYALWIITNAVAFRSQLFPELQTGLWSRTSRLNPALDACSYMMHSLLC